MITLQELSRNFSYLKQQFRALAKNTSFFVKFFCVVTILGYFLSYFKTSIIAFVITPGRFLSPPSFWIWTAFTFCFIELHIWEVLADIITVGLCGKLVEALWGQLEMIKFFAVANFGVAILSSLYYLFLYMCTKNTYFLFDIQIHGMTGYIMAITVAVKQIMPDHLILRTPFVKFTNRNIPLTVIFGSTIVWSIGFLDSIYPVMFTFGLIVSWTYLRFYQIHPNGSRGDNAESFGFASFFPHVSQPFIKVITNSIYNCCTKIGVIPKILSTDLSSVSHSTRLTGVDQHDIERRRQIALKALNERLSKTTDSSKTNSLPKSFPNKTKYTKPTSNFVETLIQVEDSGQNTPDLNLKNNELAGTSNDVSININNFDRNSLI